MCMGHSTHRRKALVQAGKFDADPHTGTSPEDGAPGWQHVVVPLFDPEP